MAGGSLLSPPTWAAYRPSALDRLVDAIARLPGWPPLTYLGLGAAVVGLLHVIGVVDGSLRPGQLSAPLVSFGTWGPLVLAAKAFTSRTASRSVDSFTPAFQGSEADREALRFRLMRQRPLATWVTGVGFIALAAPGTFLSEEYIRTTGLFTSAAALAVEAPLLVFYLWLTGAAGCGIFHQLRTISEV